MTIGSTSSAGNAPALADEQFVAVYDPNDGRIIHLHTVRVFEGGRSVSREESEQGALEAARKHGHDTARAQTLHTKEAPGRGVHRVNLKTMRLVALDKPPRR